MPDDERTPSAPPEAEPPQGLDRPHAPEPPAAAVKDNHWSDLAVAATGEGAPTVTVSVIVPVRADDAALARAIAGLEKQRYPADLIDVVVVDDGSDPPVTVPSTELRTRLLRQERDGFGAGRARNLGAVHAQGEVVLFLDVDMVAPPWLVAAHARWHEQVRDAVVIGRPLHVTADPAPDDVSSGEFDQRMRDVVAEPAPWWAEFVERTGDLTAPRGDLFAAVVSCNVSVRARFFHEIGGFTAFARRGIEDTEFGWRAFNAGALLVPDPDAGAWHIGGSHHMTGLAEKSKRQRLPLLWHWVPAGSARPRDAARRFHVPRVVVEVEAAGHAFEEVVECVDAVVGGDLRDVAAVVRVANDEEGRLAREALEADDRVVLDGDGPPAPVRLRLPQPVPVGARAVSGVCEPLERGSVGVVRVAVPTAPGEGAREVTAVAWRERAWHRARRVAADRGLDESDETVLSVAAELFGERWTSGSTHGLGAHAPAEVAGGGSAHVSAISRAQRREEEALERAARSEALVAEVERLEGQLARLRQRRAVRAMDGVGRLRRRVLGGWRGQR